uniref:(northern house mosquito) hypothetical protein n=1 Tax=Culex pipiens TaxID=7175 RepID=A0A8D8MV60_CULPI
MGAPSTPSTRYWSSFSMRSIQPLSASARRFFAGKSTAPKRNAQRRGLKKGARTRMTPMTTPTTATIITLYRAFRRGFSWPWLRRTSQALNKPSKDRLNGAGLGRVLILVGFAPVPPVNSYRAFRASALRNRTTKNTSQNYTLERPEIKNVCPTFRPGEKTLQND